MTETQTEYLPDTWTFESTPALESVAEDNGEPAPLYSLEFGLDLPQTTLEARAA